MDDNGSEGDRRPVTLPLWASIIAIAVATVAVTLLLYVLFRGTRGPGETVRAYYAAVNRGECSSAYALLSPTARPPEEATFCAAAASMKDELAPVTRIVSVLVEGDGGSRATVQLEESKGGGRVTVSEWHLVHVDGEWLIDEPVMSSGEQLPVASPSSPA